MLVDLALTPSLAKLSPGFSITSIVRQSSKPRRSCTEQIFAVNKDYSDHVIKKRTELMPKLKEARRKNQRAFLRFDKLVIYDNPVNSGSINGEKVSGESSNAD